VVGLGVTILWAAGLTASVFAQESALDRHNERITALARDVSTVADDLATLDQALAGDIEDLGDDLNEVSRLAAEFDQASVDVLLGLDERVNCINAELQAVSDVTRNIDELFYDHTPC
jgi:hypothetical protein